MKRMDADEVETSIAATPRKAMGISVWGDDTDILASRFLGARRELVALKEGERGNHALSRAVGASSPFLSSFIANFGCFCPLA